MGETLTTGLQYVQIPHHKLKNIQKLNYLYENKNPKMKGWGISFFYLYTNTSQQISKCFGSPLSCHVPFKRILHLSAGKSLSTKYQTNVSPLRILNLQSGQVAFVRSHRLMHALWKWWVQGSRYSSVPSTYGHRQIQHSYSKIRNG
jgi:hypothetical protein